MSKSWPNHRDKPNGPDRRSSVAVGYAFHSRGKRAIYRSKVPAYRAPESDVQAVRQAALDYIEGFYEGDTTKLVRSVSPTVVKYGYFVKRGEATYSGEAMPWAEFMSYANGVKANKRQAPATAPKDVAVYEVLDQTAAAKVTAWWGVDYLHLAKEDGRWMIKHVIWQTPPRTP